MACIKEGHTDPSLSREPRPRASSPQDSTFQGPEAPTVPSSGGRVPFNPPQRRYETRRPPTSPPPESSVRCTPTKRVWTSGPGESSRHAQPDPRAPTDPQRLSGISPKAIIKRPMVIAPPIEGNSNYRARPFHSELYFDLEVMQQQPELRDSFGLLQMYHLEHIMTPREFFYPIVAMNFYQSMTIQGTGSSTTIHFNIDGCQGILEARHIVEVLHIPYKPVDPADFRE